jgi:two-component system, OmpR family, copper resistance phosphate regulon response regulator CusR
MLSYNSVYTARVLEVHNTYMRILIVEDENKTADYLCKGLQQSGFIVDIARDGEDGLFLATQFHYDLIILDIMLPKIDGYTIVAKVRHSNAEVRILVLTACGSVENRVRGLELGADDYLTKPFAFSELLARVHTLLRRGNSKPNNDLCIADLKIDVLKHRAMRGIIRLELTPKEFALLLFFVQRQGEVLSRTLIAECVWDINFDSDTNVVDVAIRRLRQKIDDPFPKKLIHTVRGMGYILEVR